MFTYDNFINSKYITNKKLFKNNLELLRYKDIETFNHTLRVSNYAVLLAKELKLSEDKVELIKISGLMHDIGKILIPLYILQSIYALSTNEFEIIKKHPLDGYNIAKDFLALEACIPIVEHHERLDGLGYPFNKTDISLESRIISICDTFDAMTSQRTYQNKLSFDEALNKMDSLCERKFYDKELFNHFKLIITRNKQSKL